MNWTSCFKVEKNTSHPVQSRPFALLILQLVRKLDFFLKIHGDNLQFQLVSLENSATV
jgi:hypothetical protein